MKSMFLKNAVLGVIILSLSAISPFAIAHYTYDDEEHINFSVYPLHHAAQHGDIDEIKKILKGGLGRKLIFINNKDDKGRTVLHVMAYDYKIKTAKLLIAKGALAFIKDNMGRTPIHTAAFANAKEVVEFLFNNGGYIDTKDDFDITPLHLTSLNNAKETATFLIAHGADVNAIDKKGNTSLLYATKTNSREIIELLLANGASMMIKNADGYTALQEAELLYEEGSSLNIAKETIDMLRNYKPGQFSHLKLKIKSEKEKQ